LNKQTEEMTFTHEVNESHRYKDKIRTSFI